MSSLVTLQAAKAHLKITTTDRDADLTMKCAQASAIILDYLKGRAHEVSTTATITTSSVANPTVITTALPHGFSTGQSVFIAGHLDAVPTVNGYWTIAAAAGSSFTIPVDVTTAGSGGTVSQVWSTVTVPGPVQASVLLMLTHLVEHPGDDLTSDAVTWEAIGRLLMRARDPALA